MSLAQGAVEPRLGELRGFGHVAGRGHGLCGGLSDPDLGRQEMGGLR